jgi:hypothetical protein
MTLNFTLISLGFLGPEDINRLPFSLKEERIEDTKKVAVELFTNAGKNLFGCQIASGGQKKREIVVRADYTQFGHSAGIEVAIPSLIVADYPSDRIEMARAVVWLDTERMPLKVSHVASNNLNGLKAELNGDKLTVFEKSGAVLCTALVGPYLEDVRTLLKAK